MVNNKSINFRVLRRELRDRNIFSIIWESIIGIPVMILRKYIIICNIYRATLVINYEFIQNIILNLPFVKLIYEF